MAGQVIWCLGMYGSASTWAFNVVRQIHIAAGQDRLQSHFFSGKHGFEDFGRGNVIDLVKSHEVSDEGTVLELAARSAKILVTMRDLRDAVTSLMLSHGHKFDRALDFVVAAADLCRGYAKDRRAKLFQYETRFFEDPATVQVIAAHLGYQLPADAIQTIFDGVSRRAVEKYIAELPKLRDILRDPISGDLLDPKTQWHTHHAGRSGEIGRWKQMLTAEQVKKIEAHAGSLLAG